MKKVVMTLSALGLLVGSVMSYADTAANNTMVTNPTTSTNSMVNGNTMANTNSMVNSNTMADGNRMVTNPGVNTNTTVNGTTMNTTGTPMNSTVANKPVAQWTCEDFLVLDETVRPHAVAYGSGLHDRTKANEATYDARGTATVVPYLVEECMQNPKASFMDKVKNGWDRVKR